MGRAKEQRVCVRTLEVDAVVPYWEDTSVDRDGSQLCELTVRPKLGHLSRARLIRHSKEVSGKRGGRLFD